MSQQPTTEKYELADEFVIDNLETLKVIADPLRKRILNLFDKPRTVKMIAQELGTTPSKLYYHVNLLEEHGLLRVTDTRIVSGIIEKHYQIAARMFRVTPGLLSPTPENNDEMLNRMLRDMLDTTKEEIRASIRAGVVDLSDDAPLHRKLCMSYVTASLTEEQATVFQKRLLALIDEFRALDDEDNAGLQEYIIQFVMFPSHHRPVTDEELDNHE